ncbi:hypothetical protein MN116_004699 [Schistosoma mekongi]|uniref:BHLH domain-containing protein n=1 Tax=Schistosoma mekongi TaxID=38744 RepID=A0AAE1ZD31_SCHME|nr:hypothetical protein MN116_004699 [Schistosoma mekongi]
MEKGQTSRKQNKEKFQKESHSEIERKRRERMKLETEFLHRQVPHSQCKDKLSIFLAGAERLIHYNNKLGKREYIINDEEYSRIVMNTINGFGIHIKCSSGEILYEENSEKVLDIPQANFLGKTIYDLAEPSTNTKQIISDNLMLYGSEMQQAKDGQLISRNFVIGMRCGSGIPVKNCVRGSDGQLYRFIEFCGDIIYQSDNNYPEGCHLFRGVCRPLEMANPTVTDNTKSNSQGNSFEKPTSPHKTISPADHVTLRIGANNLLITEVVGNSLSILGWNAKDLFDKHVEEFVTIPEQNIVTQSIQETIENGSSTIYINWLNYEKTKSVYLKAVFTAIQLNSFLYCIVCKLHSTESATLPQSKPEPHSPSDYSGLQVSSDETIPPFVWNDSFNYTTTKIKPVEFSTGSHLKSNNSNMPDTLSNVDEHYVTIPKSHADGQFHSLGTPYRSVQDKNGQHSLASNSTDNEPTYISSQSKFTETHQHPVFALDSDNMIPVEMNQTNNCKYLPNNINDLEYNNTTTDGQDWRQLPLNISFSSMLSESGLPELFNPDYIKDLIREDITDL